MPHLSLVRAIVISCAGHMAARAALGPPANTCTFHFKAAKNDTCHSMAFNWLLTDEEFVSLNPSVGQGCINGLTQGLTYCVYYRAAVATTLTSASPAPSPTQYGIAPDCQQYYQAEQGDTCQKIIDAYDTFSLDDFYLWNPAVGTDCFDLQLGHYYCFSVPGTPTSPQLRPSATHAPSFLPPIFPGITTGCSKFYRVQSGDSCINILRLNGYTLRSDNFISAIPG